jgi:hypothetical protein
MIKIEILDGSRKDKKLVLLNPEAIVSVEQLESDLYVIYLLDKRKYYMTQEMFMEHFEEEESEAYYQ